MVAKKSNKEIDNSTEEKIKNAARTVFHQKGFAATRTRDIAEEAGINLALLNYYFRSKEKLFDIIMFETMSGFMQRLSYVFNDNETSLEQKIELITETYIDQILLEPEIPLFLLSELRNGASDFFEKMPLAKTIMGSSFVMQFGQAVMSGQISNGHPLQFLMNLMSLIVFPFVARPLLTKVGSLKDEDFHSLMLERKKMIPIWVKIMMTS